MSVRCRITGCDLDECGVCRRCGDESKASHQWSDADRTNPCFSRRVCDRCQAEESQPDHDWQMSESPGPDGSALKCARCGLAI
jgi:hypothetical protein